ncbi:hypothetical protein MBLNU459_g4328t1 [Dothideomycetes sp. NU459]
MAAVSSKEAAAYLIDPLTAPEPSQETGPGTHFYPSTPASAASPKSATSPTSSTNPYRKSSVDSRTGGAAHVRQASREVSGSPGGSPRPFPKYREAAFAGLNEAPRRTSGEHGKLPSYEQAAAGPSRRRGSSLKERFPGDDSNKPLDIIRRDSKKAHRSPHLRKQHIPGADSIDRLDPTFSRMPYHHEGPYDAALLARNTNYESSPVAALADSNREALKATPAENIKEALERHKPLDGVAIVPPGERDRLGRVYNYEEGTDMMRENNPEGGPYKQWPGVDYDKEDLHGQGEPSFSLDRALRAHTIHERDFDGHRGIEMSDRPLMSDYDKRATKDGKKLDTRDPVEIAGGESRYVDMQHDMDPEAHVNRTSSLRRAGEGLKKRLSMKKRRDS